MSPPELGAVAGYLLVFALFARGGCVVDDRRGVRPLGRLDGGLRRDGDRGPGHGLRLASVAVHLAFAVVIRAGYVNGPIGTRTGLRSFIPTLVGLFIFRGLSIGLTRVITARTRVGGLREPVAEDPLACTLAGRVGQSFFRWLADVDPILERPDGLPVVRDLPMSMLWWQLFSALATRILLQTRTGTWIFASGGVPDAARNVRAPVRQVKIGVFVTKAVCAPVFA